jgi:phosphoribosylformylglycinamidine synthase
MEAVVRFAREGGPVLGICNGFQVLTEAQLLPGALAMNLNQRFVCKDVYLTPGSNQHFMTRSLPSERLPLRIPIAHAEGRYLADEQTLDALEAEDRVLFYYCNSFGERSASANPNGSSRHIAGICNSMGNVIGMMPHPERAADAVLGNTDGQLLLSAFLSAAFATPT